MISLRLSPERRHFLFRRIVRPALIGAFVVLVFWPPFLMLDYRSRQALGREEQAEQRAMCCCDQKERASRRSAKILGGQKHGEHSKEAKSDSQDAKLDG